MIRRGALSALGTTKTLDLVQVLALRHGTPQAKPTKKRKPKRTY
jgi:hypothetical protein